MGYVSESSMDELMGNHILIVLFQNKKRCSTSVAVIYRMLADVVLSLPVLEFAISII